jgi:hypothetical protein
MKHLTPDQLIDALEAPDRQPHLAACAACQRQLDDLLSALNEAGHAAVPEPSPLFWQQFSTRVNDAIDHDAADAWPRWLRWQVLLPLGAAAMIILALMISVPKTPREHEPVAVESSAETAVYDNWTAVAEIVGELDLETASAAGVIAPGIADQAVLQLTAEEQQELSRLLQAELSRAKS